MKSYSNVSSKTGKKTGIKGYEYDENYITIYFITGDIYKYTLNSCGETHLKKMKELADSQAGLNTYLTKNKPPYESKI